MMEISAARGHVDPAMPRYRLCVIGSDMVDTVRCAGGWLFDRALAGWAVTALIPDLRDERPLRILGAQPVDLESAFASTEPCPEAQTLAVSADLFATDARIRRVVSNRLDRGSLEVLLWGDAGPTAQQRGAAHLRHQLSLAAVMFKDHALAAATATDPGDGNLGGPRRARHERFRRLTHSPDSTATVWSGAYG